MSHGVYSAVLSLRYIFCIFWTFSTLIISTFFTFSVMFHAYSLMISTLPMANLLSNLILVILSFQLDFSFDSLVSPYSFESHTQGQDELLVLGG